MANFIVGQSGEFIVVEAMWQILGLNQRWHQFDIGFKGTMSLLQPSSNFVELCRNYEYVMYVLSVKFKR